MIYQYAFSLVILSFVGFLIGAVGSSPFPNIYNWGDRLAVISAFLGLVSAVVGILARIWGV